MGGEGHLLGGLKGGDVWAYQGAEFRHALGHHCGDENNCLKRSPSKLGHHSLMVLAYLGAGYGHASGHQFRYEKYDLSEAWVSGLGYYY